MSHIFCNNLQSTDVLRSMVQSFNDSNVKVTVINT